MPSPHPRPRRSRVVHRIWIALLGLLVVAPLARGQKGELLGIVPHRLNTATPSEGRTEVTLRELWRVGGTGPGAETIGIVSAAFLDQEGNVCLLDVDRGGLEVYNAAGKRVRSIQPTGDTVARFRSASGACALDPQGYGLLQAYPPVLIRFDATGVPAGSVVPQMPGLPPPDSARSTISLVGARSLGEHWVFDCLVEIAIPRGLRLLRTHLLGVFDRGGYLERRLMGTENECRLDAGVTIEEREAVRYQGRWTTGPDSLIYAAPDIHRYRILVLDTDGGLRRVISREYANVPRTSEEYARVKDLFDAFAGNVPRAEAEVELAHADIQDLQVARDGTLWVLSSEGRFRAPPGVLGVYDVFDREGRFVRQVALHGEGDPNEDGIWLLEDRVIVARGIRAAALARLKGGTESGAPPGVDVVCYAR
jgi:hypothetical protein